jgi:NAD(P)-dependent dehydrogenase (short-subunit alcohol dehydrogenase family)
MGLAAARLFAAHGAQVVVTDINEAGLQETVRQVRDAGGQITAQPANVLDEASVRELVDRTCTECGALHHVLNFAAAYEPRHSTLDCTSAEWDLITGVTLKGTWLVSKHAMRVMGDNPPIGQKGWRGSIVTIASALAHRGSAGFVAYTAAKAGILGLTRAMAADGAPYRVRVNCISPGLTRTPATPLEEGSEAEQATVGALHLLPYMCEPEDQAQAALWLCSDAARCLTGAIVNVDAGWTAK